MTDQEGADFLGEIESLVTKFPTSQYTSDLDDVLLLQSEQRFDIFDALGLIKRELDSLPISGGLKGSLQSKIDSAAASLLRGTPEPATNVLQALLNELKAQAGKGLTGFQAESIARMVSVVVAEAKQASAR